jgi:hypothetical protein
MVNAVKAASSAAKDRGDAAKACAAAGPFLKSRVPAAWFN